MCYLRDMPRKKTAPKRRAAGEGSIYQRTIDGLWCGVVDVPTTDGRRRQKRVYSTDYNKCVEKLRALRDDVAKGIIPSTTTTLATWLDYWLDKIHGPHVRPKTRDFYEEAIRLHLKPRIGKKRLDRLTPQDVRAAIDGIATSRNRQRAHQVLNMALKAAVVDGVIGRNVCDAVTKPKHLPGARTAFTADQAKHIIRTAITLDESRDETTPALATRWAAAFLSGARQAEVIGLELDRLDLDRGLFDFSWQLQQLKKTHGCPEDNPCGRQRPSYCPQTHWEFDDGFEYRECYKSLVWTRPKTKTGVRLVPIIPGLLEMIRRHVDDHAGEPNPHGLVWRHSDGRPLSPTDDHEAWQHLLVAAGVTEKGATIPLHSARHSTATLLQDAGVDEPTRMAIMGQSSVAAHRGYIHVDQTQTRAALGKLAALLPPPRRRPRRKLR
jgi:integrase